MINNFQVLQFLIQDGGYYTRSQHHYLLTKTFPKDDMNLSRISSLRATMLNSQFVHIDFRIVPGGEREIKVLAVDKQFRRYARAAGVREKRSTKSYLKGEPDEVVTAIRLGMMFNQLLARVR